MRIPIAPLGHHYSGTNKPFNRPPDKSAYIKTIIFITQPKHMLWVLKRTVSMKRFF